MFEKSLISVNIEDLQFFLPISFPTSTTKIKWNCISLFRWKTKQGIVENNWREENMKKQFKQNCPIHHFIQFCIKDRQDYMQNQGWSWTSTYEWRINACKNREKEKHWMGWRKYEAAFSDIFCWTAIQIHHKSNNWSRACFADGSTAAHLQLGMSEPAWQMVQTLTCILWIRFFFFNFYFFLSSISLLAM